MVRLTFHGHSCWEIRGKEHRVLIDPFLSGKGLFLDMKLIAEIHRKDGPA
jgi:L-ascorbate metabolism protein UlaG (beta-lactamase superfamily)